MTLNICNIKYSFDNKFQINIEHRSKIDKEVKVEVKG